MDTALDEAGLSRRESDERVALPFPQWSIESWLLVLLGDEAAESKDDKARYETRYGRPVDASTIKAAVGAWCGEICSASMSSATDELARLG